MATSLFISVLTFLSLVTFGWLLRKKANIKVGLLYNLFALLLAVFVWLSLVYNKGVIGQWNMEIFFRWYYAIIIFLGVWYLTKICTAFFWDIYLYQYRNVQVPALVRNLVMVLILVTTVLLIARFIFFRQLSGLLVASSVTAAVIAFALQDFLGGLIAGIALSIQPPFEVGDWINVADQEGKVVDINWRATTLQTFDCNYLTIPNSYITAEKITNYYHPTRLHILRLQLGVEYGTPPTHVKETLIACALEAKGVQRQPKPSCKLVNFNNFSITYELECSIDDHSLDNEIRDKILTRIWYSFRRKGIRIPIPAQDVFVHESSGHESELEQKRKKKKRYLRDADIFKPLNGENIKLLMDTSSHWFFGRRERIVKQTEEGSSLFLILEGTATVSVRLPDKQEEIKVGQLSSGDFFGEKSLLTGEPRGATVQADSDIEVAEIEKSDLAPILKENPSIMEALSERLAERQLINEGFFEDMRKEEDVAEVRANYSKKFLQGMKSFFGL